MRSPCTTTKSSPHSLQLEKASMQQRRPNAAKNKERKKEEEGGREGGREGEREKSKEKVKIAYYPTIFEKLDRKSVV